MSFRQTDSFTVLPEHLLLARRLVFYYDPSIEFGAPVVDPKRPYGNSDVYRDMREILGCGDTLSEPQLRQLHEQMATVLEIASRVGEFATGTYVTPRYHRDWQRA